VLLSSSFLCFTLRRFTFSIHWCIDLLVLSFLLSFIVLLHLLLIRELMCYRPLLSMCSPTASLGNRAEGGQRASTH